MTDAEIDITAREILPESLRCTHGVVMCDRCLDELVPIRLKLKSALRDAARLVEAEKTIAHIEQALCIGAAEYVPVIGDVFTIIDNYRKVPQRE